MTECENCGTRLMSNDLDKCRDCIVNEHEDVINDIVESINKNRLRELTVVHTEVRNRLHKQR